MSERDQLERGPRGLAFELVQRLKDRILSGELAPGDRLECAMFPKVL